MSNEKENTKERFVPSSTSTKVSASSDEQEITDGKNSCLSERETTTTTTTEKQVTASKDATGTHHIETIATHLTPLHADATKESSRSHLLQT